jgi:hypothetical protein
MTKVPNVVGKTEANTAHILTAAKLGMIVKEAPSTEKKGIIFKQSPGAGASAPLGSAVTVYVSNGQKPPPTKVTVPNVVGKAKADARAFLIGAGFHVVVSEADVSDPAQDGIVIGQSPVVARANPGDRHDHRGRFTGSPSPPLSSSGSSPGPARHARRASLHTVSGARGLAHVTGPAPVCAMASSIRRRLPGQSGPQRYSWRTASTSRPVAARSSRPAFS